MSNQFPDKKRWQKAIQSCLLKDRFYCQRKLNTIVERSASKKPVDKILADLEQSIARSQKVVVARSAVDLSITYPEQLPVSSKRDEIKAAIQANQVLVLAGETGSGKTTQLPKMLLELGYGVYGQIAHTQPRRLAARSVAVRIAEELGQELGQTVGYKVRFNEQAKLESRLKLMTDGILLNEIHQDKFLQNYDAIIIDEAHERSLNIDFILGYLKQLLAKRRDLKIIITSATIDPGKFAKHFNKAPIIEVSGRTFPVEVLYSDVAEDEERDQSDKICYAVDELNAYNNGDILVFLSGEREIKDAEKQLKKRFNQTQILPLFARLSAQEQNKIFHPQGGQRIILATNVAETSLTVPRIKNVIDTGFARISRYSYRNKIQRLPIEPVSQASANQRKGRCGRLEDGICLRLYSEQDFNERPAFTDPEILRTNLASVILQMMYLRLGDIEVFPFIDPPDSRSIRDGLRLLQELGAIDEKEHITPIGKQLARLSIDPRLGRMLIEANRLACTQEVLVIASALSIQDIRERPLGSEEKAAEQHRRFEHELSDFCAYLSLWTYLSEQQKDLSSNQFRKLCKREFISYMRWREWRELYQQLSQQIKDLKYKVNTSPASHETIHQALLSGLLSHIAELSPDNDYKGARNMRFQVFPGSGQFKRKHRWIVAGEIVETSKLYGRIVAKILPEWLVDIAGHLIKKTYLEPTWSAKRGQVLAKEIQSLYGLVISANRYVDYGKVEPIVAREIFIRDGLIAQTLQGRFAFLSQNTQLINEITDIEDKTRRRDLMVDEAVLFDFYHRKLPKDINNTRALNRALKSDPELNQQLLLDKGFLLKQSIHHDVEQQFPVQLQVRDRDYPLHYRFEPGHADDGVSIEIPASALNQFNDGDFERLVPGMLEEKIIFLLRGLPKSLRKNFVPIPETAKLCFDELRDQQGDLLTQLSSILYEHKRVTITTDDWRQINIEAHYKMNVIVVNNEGKELGRGRDLEALKARLKGQVDKSVLALSDGFNKDALRTWDFGELATQYQQHVGGHDVISYPALCYEQGKVNLRLCDDKEIAKQQTQRGLRQLVLTNCQDTVRYLKKNLLHLKALAFACAHIMTKEELLAGILEAAVRDAMPHTKVVDEAGFNALLTHCRGEITGAANGIATQLREVMKAKQAVNSLVDSLSNKGNRLSIADIKQQMAALFFPGFLYLIDSDRLNDYLRYFKALEKRLERLELNPLKDEQNLPKIADFTQKIEHLDTQQADRSLWPDSWWQYRWLVEEFRVSLFSQGVKTAQPVSEKKLQRFWDERITPKR